jgi:MFS family permease
MSALDYLRSLRTDLPRTVYVLQAGVVVNAFGNGAANPFVLLYLYSVRGVPLPVAGLVSATSATCAMLAALAAGTIADRRGALPTMTAGLICSATGFALYPLVREPWHAFALALLTGTGGGVWLTLQSTVLATITPSELRHVAFARQRVAANVGLGLGGLGGGLIVTTSDPGTFTVLFVLNAATFAAYAIVLNRLRLPPATEPKTRAKGSYRRVLRDKTFMRLVVLNLIVVVAAVSLLNSVFPVYAKDGARVSETVIGALFLANCVTVVLAQLPIARAVEGRRRMRALGLMCLLFGACWLQVAAAGHVRAAVVPLVTGVLTLSFAECIYDSVQGPLTADLAPQGLLGRYMAAMGMAWQVGFILGPVGGASLLAIAPTAAWLVIAGLCAGAAVFALTIERHLPEAAMRTARREHATRVTLQP